MASSTGMAPEPTAAAPKRLFVERRSTHRYQLSPPLAILPFSDRLMVHEQAGLARGRARNISTGGIYVTTFEPLTPGCEFAFTLVLPPDLTGGGEIILRAQGKVVRTEKRLEKGIELTGVAATIETYEIVKSNPLWLAMYGARTQQA
jgi:hypothetical protein